VEAGTSAALRDAAAAVAADTAAAAAALEADRAEQSAASAALTGAREHAARDAERARTEEDDAARALADWLDACRAAGFADGEAARAAWLPPERVAELDASIMAFDRELAGARAVAAQAGEAAAGLIPPDLAALDAADAAARAAEQAAAELAARLRERHEQAAARVDAIVRADAALTAARQRHDLLRDIAGTAAGTIGKRLSLMGFVLTTILDEALAAANEHLSRMLGGRYRVRRREEPARGNATIGLDIEVLDEWTGQERPAGTLSGGEGFCAALALALGLADTVQAHAGARRIDTLFIDEGFGALDPDALDTAMDVLDGLQAGDRLVGIISHVAELRARIPAQLLVRPGARGSLAGFVTGR
jgi:exonuclease SbcC